MKLIQAIKRIYRNLKGTCPKCGNPMFIYHNQKGGVRHCEYCRNQLVNKENL